MTRTATQRATRPAGFRSETFTVLGTPAPQGSKSFKGMRGGKAIMVESCTAVKPWREAVKWSVREDAEDLSAFAGPVSLHVVFTLRRPKSAKRTARPDRKPDIDKLVRSTMDALKDAGIIEDDARVTDLYAVKRYVGELGAMATPGAVITLEHA